MEMPEYKTGDVLSDICHSGDK